MTNLYEIILAVALGLVLGIPGGYLLGRYQNSLLDKIRTLEARKPEAEPEKPAVVAGAYQPPQPFSTVPDKRPAGLVEAKTPEQLDWEAKQEFEKRVQGA